MKRKPAEPQPEPPFFDENGAFHFRPTSSDARLATWLEWMPEELAWWFEGFESCCVMACCGLDALAFKPSTEWNRWPYKARIMAALWKLQAEVEASPSEVLRVPDFQVALYKTDLLFLLRYLQEQMQKSIEWNIER